MSDIFAPLREPETVSPLAPEEVRRRGDRLRRRRTGLAVVAAAVAAAVVVGVPSLVAHDRAKSDAPPGPVDSAETVIPAQFDLADGLSRGSTVTPGAPSLEPCGEAFSLEERTTASTRVGQADNGDVTVRALSVYPDAATARSVATSLVAAFEDCPRATDGRGREWTTTVRPTPYGDQGWAVAQSVVGPGPRPDLAEVTHVVRVGANLLVIHQREIHGVPSADLDRWIGDQVASLMHRQMCLLTEQGCAWRSDPDVLRPDGWGAVRLRMSREELDATGVARLGDSGDCAEVDLGPGQGWFSEANGLLRIQVPDGVTTPDGVGVGSTRDEVRETYPFAEGRDVMLVRASPTADYEMTVEGGRVTRLALSTAGVDCVG